MIKYDKLVRDNIPEIIEEDGKKANIRIVKDEEYLSYLVKKLSEEAKEIEEDTCVEELADLETIIRSICEYLHISKEDFEKVYNKKIEKRGGFKKGIVLESVETNE